MLESSSLNLLERSLDASMLRQKVIANNIANVDTPNFKRSEVRFEELLRNQMGSGNMSIAGYRTDPRHFQIGTSANQVQPSVVTDNSTIYNHNNNNVDIEYEMAQLADNQLRYNLMIDRVNGYFKDLRTAISGR